MNEWDRENVIMSGSSDGVVRMWSMDLIEVPIIDVHHSSREENKKDSGTINSQTKIRSNAKKMDYFVKYLRII